MTQTLCPWKRSPFRVFWTISIRLKVRSYVDENFWDGQKSYRKRVDKAFAPYYPVNDHSNQLNVTQELHDGHQSEPKPPSVSKERGHRLQCCINHVLNAGYSVLGLQYLKSVQDWFYRAEAIPRHKISKRPCKGSTGWRNLRKTFKKDPLKPWWILLEPQRRLPILNYSCYNYKKHYSIFGELT